MEESEEQKVTGITKGFKYYQYNILIGEMKVNRCIENLVKEKNYGHIVVVNNETYPLHIKNGILANNTGKKDIPPTYEFKRLQKGDLIMFVSRGAFDEKCAPVIGNDIGLISGDDTYFCKVPSISVKTHKSVNELPIRRDFFPLLHFSKTLPFAEVYALWKSSKIFYNPTKISSGERTGKHSVHTLLMKDWLKIFNSLLDENKNSYIENKHKNKIDYLKYKKEINLPLTDEDVFNVGWRKCKYPKNDMIGYEVQLRELLFKELRKDNLCYDNVFYDCNYFLPHHLFGNQEIDILGLKLDKESKENSFYQCIETCVITELKRDKFNIEDVQKIVEYEENIFRHYKYECSKIPKIKTNIFAYRYPKLCDIKNKLEQKLFFPYDLYRYKFDKTKKQIELERV